MKSLCAGILVFLAFSNQLFSEDTTMSLKIQEVKAKHEDRLLAMPGVVSVGIGRDPDGKSIIIIGLDRPRPETAKQLPKVLDG